MAEQMQAIKRRMKSVGSTEKITGAMKLVSAAKLKQATYRFNYVSKHIEPLISRFNKILSCDENTPEVYFDAPVAKDEICILITASKGLCGSYNATLNKYASASNNAETTIFAPIGGKGHDFCLRSDSKIFEQESLSKFYSAAADEHSYDEIEQLSTKILNLYRKEEVSGIKIIYAKYRNSIAFDTETKQIFPLASPAVNNSEINDLGLLEYSAETDFFDGLADSYLAMQIFRCITEATLCEHASRRIAMKNANDNAKEMLESLSIQYHRARQNAITNEIIEIIAGSESQKLQNKLKKNR